MKSTITYYQHQKEYRQFVENTFQDLVILKKEEDKEGFNKKMIKILPEMKKYIQGRLKAFIKKGGFPKGKYHADAFVDQLFIEVYEHIDEIKKEKDFYLWLFKKTNELLEDTILEEEFNNLFLQNIDDYTKPEWDTMVEDFSADAEGDLLMMEEFDDISYSAPTYNINAIFIEDSEKELTQKLDKALREEDINRHINMVLSHFPLAMQTVFDLYTNQHFTLEEIAIITNTTVQEVETLLKAAKRNLEKSFFNRYFKGNKKNENNDYD